MSDKIYFRSGPAADRPLLSAREPSIDSDTNMTWIGTALGNLALNQSQNLMINSGMSIAQRGTSFTITNAASAYTLDRIKSINNGSGVNATVTQVEVSDQDGTGYGIKMVHATLPTIGGTLMHVYTLEARDAYKWAGRTLTASARVKAVGAMDKATMKALYKTSESAISDSSTLIAAGTATTINNSGETLVTVKFTVPSRAALTTSGVWGVQIIASKSTAEASGDGFIVTEWQINPGDVPQPYQPLDDGYELLRCQRYFETSYDYGATIGGASATGILTAACDNTGYIAGAQFKVKKRVAPTNTLYSGASTTANRVRAAGTGTEVASAVAVANNGMSGFGSVNAAGAFVAGTLYNYHLASDAEL